MQREQRGLLRTVGTLEELSTAIAGLGPISEQLSTKAMQRPLQRCRESIHETARHMQALRDAVRVAMPGDPVGAAIAQAIEHTLEALRLMAPERPDFGAIALLVQRAATVLKGAAQPH